MMDGSNANQQRTERDSERELVQRFRQGCDLAFVQIVEEYNPQVQALAGRLIGWNGHAEDIAQDVFVAALANRKKFKAKSSIRTWLFTITMNKCRSWLFRQKLASRFVKSSGEEVNSKVHTDVQLQQEEKFQQVRDAVQKLPFKYRQVIVLRYLNELGADEVSEILNMPRSVLNTRLHRARKMLEKKLADYMEEK